MNKTLPAIIKRLKTGDKPVTIRGTAGATRFNLVLVRYVHANDPHIIRLLGEWRKQHEKWFPSRFPVTDKRTAAWLSERVLKERDRLLFMISVNGEFYGHAGLYRFDFQNRTCQIDNIVRGKRGVKRLMEASVRALMRWGTKTLGIRSYTLETTSDNQKALLLYERLHFIETKRIPLVTKKLPEAARGRNRQQNNQETRYSGIVYV